MTPPKKQTKIQKYPPAIEIGQSTNWTKKSRKSLKIRYFGLKLFGKQHLYFVLGYNLALILQAAFRSYPLLSKLVRHVSLGLLEAKICWDSYLSTWSIWKQNFWQIPLLKFLYVLLHSCQNQKKNSFFPCLPCP